MARIRTLKPEALQHRKVGQLSDRAFRLWIGMLTQADDEGRLSADPLQLRTLVFGYQPRTTPAHVLASMEEVAQTGLIRIYFKDGNRYVDFPSWQDHQRVDHPTPSKLPSYHEGEDYRKRAIPAAVRRAVAVRYGAALGQPATVTCHYCGTAQGTITVFSETGWVHFAGLELEHVVPECLGGPTAEENLVLACRPCNRKKALTIPLEDSRGLASVPGGSEGIGREEKGRDEEGSDREPSADPRRAGSAAPPTVQGNGNLDPELAKLLAECPHLALIATPESAGFWDRFLAACQEYPQADSRWVALKLRKWDQYFASNPAKRSKQRPRLEQRLMGWLAKDLEGLARAERGGGRAP